jgi:hypothetical protein
MSEAARLAVLVSLPVSRREHISVDNAGSRGRGDGGRCSGLPAHAWASAAVLGRGSHAQRSGACPNCWRCCGTPMHRSARTTRSSMPGWRCCVSSGSIRPGPGCGCRVPSPRQEPPGLRNVNDLAMLPGTPPIATSQIGGVDRPPAALSAIFRRAQTIFLLGDSTAQAHRALHDPTDLAQQAALAPYRISRSLHYGDLYLTVLQRGSPRQPAAQDVDSH